jgi:hypothetical protein
MPTVINQVPSGDKIVVFQWSDKYGACQECSAPAAFLSIDAYGPDSTEQKLCAVCAANAAADGETIKRIEVEAEDGSPVVNPADRETLHVHQDGDACQHDGLIAPGSLVDEQAGEVVRNGWDVAPSGAAQYATLLMVVRLDDHEEGGDYETLEREALEAAGIPRQPTDESLFLRVSPGISAEATRLGADPSNDDPNELTSEQEIAFEHRIQRGGR